MIEVYHLIDEVQMTYSDPGLWSGLFRSIMKVNGPYTMLFSSYGVAEPNPNAEDFPSRLERRKIEVRTTQNVLSSKSFGTGRSKFQSF
jgi:hypothetical protein